MAVIILARSSFGQKTDWFAWFPARLLQVVLSWTKERLDTDRIVMLDAALLFQIGIGSCWWIRKNWGASLIETWLLRWSMRSLALERVVEYLVFQGLVHHSHVEVVLNRGLRFSIPSSYCQVENIRLGLPACVKLWGTRLRIGYFTQISAALFVVRWTYAAEGGHFPVSVVFIRRTPLGPVVRLAVWLLWEA